jgi:hypothetical protein
MPNFDLHPQPRRARPAERRKPASRQTFHVRRRYLPRAEPPDQENQDDDKHDK